MQKLRLRNQSQIRPNFDWILDLMLTMWRVAKVTPYRLFAVSGSIITSNLCLFKLSLQNHSLYFEQLLCWHVLNLELSTLPLNMNGRKRTRSPQKWKRQGTKCTIINGEEYVLIRVFQNLPFFNSGKLGKYHPFPWIPGISREIMY